MAAAGGAIVPGATGGDAVLLVNNFEHYPQTEAPNQPLSNRSIADYAMFDAFACDPAATVGFVDNRYSNGGDLFLQRYMAARAASCGLSMDRFAYAGVCATERLCVCVGGGVLFVHACWCARARALT